MRNIIAIILGLIVSFILFSLVSILIMKLNIEPYYGFSKGNFVKNELGTIQNKVIFLNYFLIFPFVSLITCCIVTFIAKNREYIVGLCSIIPVVVLSFDSSILWLFSLLVVVGFSLIGVTLSKKLKAKKTKLSP